MSISEIILLITLIISFIGLIVSIKNNNRISKNELNNKLFNLQKISFNFPFLEDKHFICNWNSFKKQYNSTESYVDSKYFSQYLQYEQYCEMLFNFIEETYNFYKSEKGMLEYCDFKSWVRNHKDWWNNPLEDYSNQDTYKKEVKDIINNWLK